MTSYFEFSAPVRELLYRAGWHADRKQDVEVVVKQLTGEGFPITPNAVGILTSLYGITVVIPPSELNPYRLTVEFDPINAATGEADRAWEWRDAAGIGLFPIGREVGFGNIIWDGSDGRIYYGRGFGLYQLGDDLPSAMTQLVFPLKSPPLIAP